MFGSFSPFLYHSQLLLIVFSSDGKRMKAYELSLTVAKA
jgi:hypothetical protein